MGKSNYRESWKHADWYLEHYLEGHCQNCKFYDFGACCVSKPFKCPFEKVKNESRKK